MHQVYRKMQIYENIAPKKYERGGFMACNTLFSRDEILVQF